jgi:hypothetical protein
MLRQEGRRARFRALLDGLLFLVRSISCCKLEAICGENALEMGTHWRCRVRWFSRLDRANGMQKIAGGDEAVPTGEFSWKRFSY